MQVERDLEKRSDGDIALTDILGFIGRHIGLIAVFTVVGGAVGMGVSTVVPQAWEATTVVMVGRVGNELVEPVANAVERAGTGGFAQRVVQAAGTPVRADMIAGSLRAAPRGTDLIAITVKGPSQADAARYAAAAGKVMIAEQDVKQARAVDALKREGVFADRLRERSEKARDEWTSYAKGVTAPGAKPQLAEVLLLKEMISRNDLSVDVAIKAAEKVQRSLRDSETYPSRAFDDGTPVAAKVFPSRTKFLGAGIIAGLLLGGIISLVRELRLRGRHQAAAR
ncbi:Wzz/FepE/Etk N-terminal domain-containing protein [Pandoraea pnomenusa]|uniref:Wzz/FepE/Etk N-terminal domain-containing protein n=1 Tax=Pandoraea pnomenusa TaxID=93220 RepID=UPI003342B27E